MDSLLKVQHFLPKHFQVSEPTLALHHVFTEKDCYALWAAYAAGRPLLVRGAPGTGKSQLAKAMAVHLGWAFVSETINGSTELSDLHYHFDAVGRLGEAQLQGFSTTDNEGVSCMDSVQTRLNPLRFLSPGAFWWAYDWASAERQYAQCYSRLRPKPYKPSDWHAQKGVVLLLDEIDKADPDLPNGLLETLGHYQFTVPYLAEQDNPIHATPTRVLVVISTNEERELPSAFVRRCFVHTLTMETSREFVKIAGCAEPIEKRLAWLVERGRLHFAERVSIDVCIEAARQLWQDRDEHPHSRYPAGLAEYLDLLKALSSLSLQEQTERLTRIAAFALAKDLAE